MLGGLGAARRLAEPAPLDRDHRIAAEHRAPLPVDRQRLGLGQRERDFAGAGPGHLGLERALVDRGGPDLELDPGGAEHGAARGALRSEYDHGVAVPASVACSSRSSCSFITAAAVSSIERRVTSITGQPLSAKIRRAKATSCSTRSSST